MAAHVGIGGGFPKLPPISPSLSSNKRAMQKRSDSLDSVGSSSKDLEMPLIPGDILLVPKDDDDDDKQTRQSWLSRKVRQHYQSTIAKVPPKYRWLFLFFWVAWKVVAVYLLYYVVRPMEKVSTANIPWVPSILPSTGVDSKNTRKGGKSIGPVRVMYIVTSVIDEHEDTEISLSQMLPLLRHNVASILQEGYHVDLFWIIANDNENAEYDRTALHTAKVQQTARRVFPAQVGLTIWPRASPLVPHQGGRLVVRRHTAQEQAWWVIRDKFPLYHVFMVWPDRARLLGTHVNHFWTMSQQLLVEQQNDPAWERYVPAMIPLTTLPHGHYYYYEARNSTVHARKLPPTAVVEEHQQLLSSNLPLSHSTISLSLNGSLELGPSLNMPRRANATSTPVTSSQPTVVLPVGSLSSTDGFMVSRSQLASHGFFQCLFPKDIPIAWPVSSNHDKSPSSFGIQRHTCLPPGPGILLASNPAPHFVQFIEQPGVQKRTKRDDQVPAPTVNSLSAQGTSNMLPVDMFLQHVESLVGGMAISAGTQNNRTTQIKSPLLSAA